MDKFLERHKVTKQASRRENLRSTRSKKTVLVIKLIQKKSPEPNSLTDESYQHFQKRENTFQLTLWNRYYPHSKIRNITRKLQINIPYSYRHKNPQQNTIKLNMAKYKRYYTPGPSEIYPRMQGQFKVQNSIIAIHHYQRTGKNPHIK